MVEPQGERSVSDERIDMRRVIEALLFLSDEPVSAVTLAQVMERGRREVEDTLEEIADDLERRRSGIVLRRIAGGWRLLTHPDTHPFVERYILSSRHAR